MRKCIRCGSIMKENCAVKVEGEVSIYLDDVERLKNLG